MEVAKQLPALRPELDLVKETKDRSGDTVWLIYDPIRHKYFYISRRYFHLLSTWRDLRIEGERVLAGNGEEIPEAEFRPLFEFLQKNQLLNSPVSRKSPSSLHSLTKLLFLRIPIWSPQKTLDYVIGFVGSRNIAPLIIGYLALGAVGVVLLLRQWEDFLATFSYLFSFSGWVGLILAIAVSKFFHEMGHGLIARYYNCNVNSAGIALFVGFPLFFVDVSDGWRASSNAQRALISAGGLIAEGLVAIAFIWIWLTALDGPLRTTAHMMVTTTFLTTLLVNLNPLIRFDGYFLLSDLLNIENLNGKSSEMARWLIRKTFLGWVDPPPVEGSARMRVFLVCFGYLTWLWRLLIFLGISWFLYEFFFKLAGILLMGFVGFSLVLMPVLREARVWWDDRQKNRYRKTLGPFALLGAVLIYILFPSSHKISLPAVLISEYRYQITAPQSGFLEYYDLSQGDNIRDGQTLLAMVDRSLDLEKKIEVARLRSIDAELDQLLQSSAELEKMRILQQQRAGHINRIENLDEIANSLVLKAPHGGVVSDIPFGLRPGSWVSEGQDLGFVIDVSKTFAWASVSDLEWDYIELGAEGRFYPDNPAWPSFELRVSEVEQVPIRELSMPYQKSIHGGQIAVISTGNSDSSTVNSIYRVNLEFDDVTKLPTDHAIRGTVRLDSTPYSILGNWLQRLGNLIRRESGF